MKKIISEVKKSVDYFSQSANLMALYYHVNMNKVSEQILSFY